MNFRRSWLDPEVEQLLREVAAQPGSILLRVDYSPFRRQVFPGARARRREVSIAGAHDALYELTTGC